MDLRLGAGAFVCGEETALIASVEGKRGTPRPRPPYPAMEGLFGQPTLINNVETFANIAPIIRNGGEWYAQIGTEKSKGTKVFALAGRVENTGLVEVPMGISLREMVFEIGGGIPEGRKFKAVQTGGPSGGCLPSECLDMPVDYESLAKRRIDHGLRRHDRDGRKFLHGRRGQILHGLLHDRVLRQVHPVPRGHLPDASHSHRHRQHDRDAAGLENAGRTLRPAQAHQPVRAGTVGAQSGGQHAALVCRGVPGAHRRSQVSGRSLWRAAAAEGETA